VRLSDVLMAAGVNAEDDLHVEFVGLDDVERHGKQFNFGGSVPIEKAFNREVLLAYEMNGEPLPPIHGFPLRVVVPGYIGARSVKWLSEIRVRRGPSENYFQDHAYRLFAPDVNAENVKWETGLMLGQMQLNSVICVPVPEGAAKAGEVTVRGYAIAGGARQVSRVEISADNGATWRQAELEGEGRPWTWRLWTARLKLLPGRHELAVRAVDSGANVQPSEMKQIWNFKGYMANAWHRQSIEVK
jgi:sulfite oxidase